MTNVLLIVYFVTTLAKQCHLTTLMRFAILNPTGNKWFSVEYTCVMNFLLT